MGPGETTCEMSKHPTPDGQNILIVFIPVGKKLQNDHECEARMIYFSLGLSA